MYTCRCLLINVHLTDVLRHFTHVRYYVQIKNKQYYLWYFYSFHLLFIRHKFHWICIICSFSTVAVVSACQCLESTIFLDSLAVKLLEIMYNYMYPTNQLVRWLWRLVQTWYWFVRCYVIFKKLCRLVRNIFWQLDNTNHPNWSVLKKIVQF